MKLVVNALGGKTLEKGSEENGGPLSEKNHLGIPYCENTSLQALD